MVPIDFDGDGEYAQLSWVKQADQLGVLGGYDFGGWATMNLVPAPVVIEPETSTDSPVDAPADAPSAPATSDAGIVAAAAVMAVAAGVVLSKKK